MPHPRYASEGVGNGRRLLRFAVAGQARYTLPPSTNSFPRGEELSRSAPETSGAPSQPHGFAVPLLSPAVLIPTTSLKRTSPDGALLRSGGAVLPVCYFMGGRTAKTGQNDVRRPKEKQTGDSSGTCIAILQRTRTDFRPDSVRSGSKMTSVVPKKSRPATVGAAAK